MQHVKFGVWDNYAMDWVSCCWLSSFSDILKLQKHFGFDGRGEFTYFLLNSHVELQTHLMPNHSWCHLFELHLYVFTSYT